MANNINASLSPIAARLLRGQRPEDVERGMRVPRSEEAEAPGNGGAVGDTRHCARGCCFVSLHERSAHTIYCHFYKHSLHNCRWKHTGRLQQRRSILNRPFRPVQIRRFHKHRPPSFSHRKLSIRIRPPWQ